MSGIAVGEVDGAGGARPIFDLPETDEQHDDENDLRDEGPEEEGLVHGTSIL